VASLAGQSAARSDRRAASLSAGRDAAQRSNVSSQASHLIGTILIAPEAASH
jgi:hypothetical protein